MHQAVTQDQHAVTQDQRDDAYAVSASEAALWPDTSEFLSPEALATIASAAPDADAAGQVPEESFQALRDSGYLSMPVPTEFEGGGATLLQCAAAQRRLAIADPALAIGTNMHLFSLGVMVEHWRRAKDNSWLLLEAIATQRRLVASAFAEPGLAGSLLRSHCTATPVEKGYQVSGVKMPCSLAARSDLLCLQLQLPEDGDESLLVALVPTDSPGVRVKRTWDTLGMRASESDTVILTDCVIPEDLVFHRCRPGFDADEVFAAGLVWFCITATATYLGLASELLTRVRQALHKSRVRHLDAVRAELPSVQTALGELTASLATQELACAGLARTMDHPGTDPRGLLPAALGLKHTTVDVCTRLVGEAAELVGAQSYGRRGPFERFLRDVQAVRFHPPTRLATRQMLGRWALGFPFSFELDERPVRTASAE